MAGYASNLRLVDDSYAFGLRHDEPEGYTLTLQDPSENYNLRQGTDTDWFGLEVICNGSIDTDILARIERILPVTVSELPLEFDPEAAVVRVVLVDPDTIQIEMSAAGSVVGTYRIPFNTSISTDVVCNLAQASNNMFRAWLEMQAQASIGLVKQSTAQANLTLNASISFVNVLPTIVDAAIETGSTVEVRFVRTVGFDVALEMGASVVVDTIVQSLLSPVSSAFSPDATIHKIWEVGLTVPIVVASSVEVPGVALVEPDTAGISMSATAEAETYTPPSGTPIPELQFTIGPYKSGNPLIYITIVLMDNPVTIDWGDGSYDTYTTTGQKSHDYPALQNYTIKITGGLRHIKITPASYNSSSPTKIVCFESFGNHKYWSMANMFDFYGSRIDDWTTPSVPDLSEMVIAAYNNTSYGLYRFGLKLGSMTSGVGFIGWDVSRVHNFEGMFQSSDTYSDFTVSGPMSPIDFSGSTILGDANFKSFTALYGETRLFGFKAPIVTGNVYLQSAFYAASDSVNSSGTNSYYDRALPGQWKTQPIVYDFSGFQDSQSVDFEYLSDGAFRINHNVSYLYSKDVNISGLSGYTVSIDNNKLSFGAPLYASYVSPYANLRGSYTIDVSGWNTSHVPNMASMFRGLSGAKYLNIQGWSCAGATGEATSYSSAVGMYRMFYGTDKLDEIYGIAYLNTTGVQNMSYCFGTDADSRTCTSPTFNPAVGSWNMSSVKYLRQFISYYRGAAFNQDLSSWDLSSCLDVTDTFRGNGGIGGASALTPLNIAKIYIMLDNTASSVTTGKVIDMRTKKYDASGAAARASLITKGWTITDGGQE